MIHVQVYWYAVAKLAIKRGLLSEDAAYEAAEKQIRDVANRLDKLIEKYKDATL